MYPNVAAMADVFGKAKVGVIHFDAHYDATDAGLGLNLTHGTPVRRLIEQGHASGHNFIQVGTRGWAPNDKDLGWMRDHGFRYHNMAQVDKFGWDWVMDRAIEEASDGTDYLYISMDMDVFDPAFAPGTGTPEPNGLTPREMFPILRRLGAEKNVVGVELVELNPFADSTYATGLIANHEAEDVDCGHRTVGEVHGEGLSHHGDIADDLRGSDSRRLRVPLLPQVVAHLGLRVGE
jgi:agmatinase